MKVRLLGLASAVLASTGCVVPLGLALAGLGSLGFGSLVGPYHWYFTGGAVALLALAWWGFFREREENEACDCDSERISRTQSSLVVASVAVAFFLALNVSTRFVPRSLSPASAEAAVEVITVPVRGMSCVLCERPIESSVEHVQGVLEADASAARNEVTVKAKRGAVSLERIAAAIRAAGYEPEIAESGRES